MGSRALFIVVACVILAGLVISIGPKVNAQNPNGRLTDLLRPYIHQQINVTAMTHRPYNPSTLKDVGVDYILLDTPQGETEAIPLTMIYGVTMKGETVEIHIGGF